MLCTTFVLKKVTSKREVERGRVCYPAGDGCGPTVLGPTSGTLSSLGYPWTYPNNSVCEWEITVPRGNRLHFRFAELDVEDKDCQVNYLRLFNGIGPGRSEIGERAGSGVPAQTQGGASSQDTALFLLAGDENEIDL